jgi:hypothetical protein
MFEAFSQIAFQLFAVPNQGYFFTLCALRRHLFKFCALFFQRKRKWQLRNDSADDLARLVVANLYCEMHFQLLIPTWQHFDSWFKKNGLA